MKKKTIYLSVGMMIILAVLVVAQVGGGLGGNRGNLGLPTTPLITDHVFRNCPLTGQNKTIHFEISDHNNITKTFTWRGYVKFADCERKENLGHNKVDYNGRLTARQELNASVTSAYMREYNKQRVSKNNGRTRGNYSG